MDISARECEIVILSFLTSMRMILIVKLRMRADGRMRENDENESGWENENDDFIAIMNRFLR